MSDTPTEERTKETVKRIVDDSATKRFIFTAESYSGQWFSCPKIQDMSGESEAQMIAEYIGVVSARTGRDPEDIFREVAEKINNRAFERVDE
jgi:hypothetical protein